MLEPLLRWTGRLTSVLVLAFIALSATVPASAPTRTESVGLVLFPGAVAAGLLLAWWREPLGAAVATGGLAGFYAWSGVSGAHFAGGPWFLVCWSPTVCFVGSWLLRRERGA